MNTSVTCRYFDTSQLIRSNDVACIVSLPTTVLALVEGHVDVCMVLLSSIAMATPGG